MASLPYYRNQRRFHHRGAVLLQLSQYQYSHHRLEDKDKLEDKHRRGQNRIRRNLSLHRDAGVYAWKVVVVDVVMDFGDSIVVAVLSSPVVVAVLSSDPPIFVCLY